jgi:hypothetical protein
MRVRTSACVQSGLRAPACVGVSWLTWCGGLCGPARQEEEEGGEAMEEDLADVRARKAREEEERRRREELKKSKVGVNEWGGGSVLMSEACPG